MGKRPCHAVACHFQYRRGKQRGLLRFDFSHYGCKSTMVRFSHTYIDLPLLIHPSVAPSANR